MRKFLIVLAVVCFVIAFAVPAMAAPRASPIAALVGDMMIVPTTMATAINTMRVLTVPTAMATNHHRTLLAEMWGQATLDVNYQSYHGRLIGLSVALANENSTLTLTDGSMIRVRISAIHLYLAPVAYLNANEFSFGQRQERQRAAHYDNLTNTCMAAPARMGIPEKSTVLRL